jgi:hypothetical protein
MKTSAKAGQFRARHEAIAFWRMAGIVVAKIAATKPNSDEIMHRNLENDCLVLIYATKRHNTWKLVTY